MKRPAVTTARIIRLYQKHGSISAVAMIVKRNYTTVRSRLIRAGILTGQIWD